MELGSIQEVTERLRSWCVRNDRGLARVGWDSAYARQEVVDRLRRSLDSLAIPLVEIELPPGEAGEATAAGLIEKLRSVSGSVVSITGIEWAFPEGGDKVDTLAALSFQRETLAALPVRQIWWVPSSLTERFILGVPDLDSWFLLRLHLTEAPPQPANTGRELERKMVSVAEARSLARRFWERLEASRAQKLPEDRIWTELAQPAVEALLSSGLGREADAILASVSVARGTMERELQDLTASRGSEDLEVLALTGRLARLLSDQGDFAGARRLQEQVLEATKRAQGEERRDTLAAMNNLALTLRAQGDRAGARRLQERVLEAIRRVLGEDHPHTLRAMDNLASTLREQGDLDEARRLQERVLDVTRRVLGDEHPDALRSMNNLAETLRSQGDLDGARRLQERALDVMTRVLGDEHPDTLTVMDNLALTLQAQGDLDGARRLQERVLGGTARLLGEEHPHTLTAMNNLAVLLSKAGDRPEAVRLLRKCLHGRRKVLGENHPETAGTAELLRRLEEQSQTGQSGG